jgi:Zn-dependent protease with chaperone function/type II secretory pathway pseudopilin PulG
MQDLVCSREKTLGSIMLVLGLVGWALLIVGTFGTALIGLLLGFIVYLFAQSALIAHIKGNGVELSARQFPDLDEHFRFCCDRLELGPEERPVAYVLNGNGHINAFATRFLGSQYVVLMSDTVDAMRQLPEGLRFYIGHELGHLKRKHLTGALFRWPALWLPLLGSAYARAKETTCDRHGRACCDSAETAGQALAALSAGPERFSQLNLDAYAHQTRHSGGFWMSFHELLAGYPWISKRVQRIARPEVRIPRRNGLAYVPALVVPYAGRAGGAFGFLIMVYIIGVLAAVAIPQYKEYTVRAQLSAVVPQTESIRQSLATYYAEHQEVPASLEALGVPTQLPSGATLTLDAKTMTLEVHTPAGELDLVPKLDKQQRMFWVCESGTGLTAAELPPACKSALR